MKNLNILRLLIVFVGISGAFSVLFGAWFAHAGQALPLVDKVRLESAQFYQFIHTLALLAIIVWYVKLPSKRLMVSGLCFTLGILCFCGTLYLKTFFAVYSIGTLAPVGGILLAAGWLLLSFVGKQSLQQHFKSTCE